MSVLPSRITVSSRHRPRPCCHPRPSTSPSHRARLGDPEKNDFYLNFSCDLCPCVGGGFDSYSRVSFSVPGVHSCGFAQEMEKGSTEEYCLKSTLCEFGNKIENRNEEDTNNKRFY